MPRSCVQKSPLLQCSFEVKLVKKNICLWKRGKPHWPMVPNHRVSPTTIKRARTILQEIPYIYWIKTYADTTALICSYDECFSGTLATLWFLLPFLTSLPLSYYHNHQNVLLSHNWHILAYLRMKWLFEITVFIILTLKVLNFWKFTSYCSLKSLWSGMGEEVPARTSPTLHPPSPPTVHQLSWLALQELISKA